jgi:hypothetical protein
MAPFYREFPLPHPNGGPFSYSGDIGPTPPRKTYLYA